VYNDMIIINILFSFFFLYFFCVLDPLKANKTCLYSKEKKEERERDGKKTEKKNATKSIVASFLFFHT